MQQHFFPRVAGVAAVAGLVACPGSSGDSDSAMTMTTTSVTGTTDATPTSTGEVVPTTGEVSEDGPFRLEFVELAATVALKLLTDFVFLPGTDPPELLLTRLDGHIAHYRLDGDELALLGVMTVPGVHFELDCGLVSLAIDPGFADNGLMYAGICTSGEEVAVVRLTFDRSDYAGVAATAAEVMRISEPEAKRPWHNVGAMGFDDAGVLWILVGDKTATKNSQDPSNNFGALLRVVPNRAPDGSGYTPAPDNPFADDPTASPDIYAYGLRSPWRGLLDHRGRYWIGDVGNRTIEEVNLVTAPGPNFGWATHEGPCEANCAAFTDPLLHYEHVVTHPYSTDDDDLSASTLRAVWVGAEYHAPATDRYRGHLDDRVIFGDFCGGFVRAAAIDADAEVIEDVHIGHLNHAVAWRVGPDGFLYAASFGSCTTQVIDPEAPPPSRFFRVESRGGGSQ